ncbi:MAG: TIGR04100 family radical SAM protein [Clostridia bacterium]|nr:TIGR04100 family radical SAM protein [Clostridia bacterium]
MTILYEFEGGLYVNLTNACTCACVFCIRGGHDGVGDADSLWLERDPTEDEVLDAFRQHDLSAYREVVFCGFGEPTERLDVLLAACRYIRSVSDIPIRLNTNGLAELSLGKSVAPLFEGLIDTVSISMNAPTAAEYVQVTQPSFGEKAFDAMLQFVRDCKRYVPHVMVTAVDVITPEQAERCRKLAESLGVPFRLRNFT